MAVGGFVACVFVRHRQRCRSQPPPAAPEPHCGPGPKVAVALEPGAGGRQEARDGCGLLAAPRTAAPKDTSRLRSRVCPKGHALQIYTVPWSGDFGCDACGRDIRAGAAVWSCRGCKYDACSGCSLPGEEGESVSPQGTPRLLTVANDRDTGLHGMFFGAADRAALAEDPVLDPDDPGMVAARPPRSMALPSAPCAKSLDEIDLHLLRHGCDSAETGVESAIRTVNSTTMRLSQIMAEVQVAPTGLKPALLAQAEALESGEEYLHARHLLESLKPDVVGTAPPGDDLMEEGRC